MRKSDSVLIIYTGGTIGMYKTNEGSLRTFDLDTLSMQIPELNTFDIDRHQVVQKAIEQGVDKMLLPNINSETLEAMHQLCKDFPQHCYPMMGLHPCDVKDDYEEELKIIKSHLDKGKYVAIGEIGIDLYWEKSTLDIQKKLSDSNWNGLKNTTYR